MNTHEQPWFVAKTVYYNKKLDVYEERLVLHRATSFDEAWKKNDEEIDAYCKAQNEIDSPVELVKTIEIYHLFDAKLQSGTELFSSMRRVQGSRSTYIKNAYEKGMNYKIA